MATDPTQVVKGQPVAPPTVNDAGQKINYGANSIGTNWNPATKTWEENRIPGVNWENNVTNAGTFADGSVKKAYTLYDAAAIPQKGYEEPKPYVPSEFSADAARIGIGGGLNRTVVEGEVDPNKQADDPNYARKKVPVWPFMYVQGVK